MPDFTEQDLDGARFHRVSLRAASFEDVYLTDATFHDVDFSGATVRAASFDRFRMRGVLLRDVDIDGEIGHLVVNGVDVGPLVEAELDRRHPERTLMRPVDPQGFRDAWDTLGRLWDGTVERARALPAEALHVSVDGEWSFIQTLRHLGHATAAWAGGMVEHDPDPWHPLDLPYDEAPGWEGVPWDRDARPSLDEVLAIRAHRRARVQQLIDGLTAQRLVESLTSATPCLEDRDGSTVRHALQVVVHEEWEHRLFAERDLAILADRMAADRMPVAAPEMGARS